MTTLLLGIELANTVLTSRLGSLIRNKASVAASALSCASMLSVMAIVYAEHRRSHRSSSFLSAFLSITMLFNVARARSYISRGGLDTFGALQVVIAVLKFVLISLEELSKHGLFQSRVGRNSIGPEMRGGFWNRSLFVWVNNTLLIGFKNVIGVKDLPEIGLEFSTERLSVKFEKPWKSGSLPTNPLSSNFPLLTLCSQQSLTIRLADCQYESSRLATCRHCSPQIVFHSLYLCSAFSIAHHCNSSWSTRAVERRYWRPHRCYWSDLLWSGGEFDSDMSFLLSSYTNHLADNQGALHTCSLPMSRNEPWNARLCHLQTHLRTRLDHGEEIGRRHPHEHRCGQHRIRVCHHARPLGRHY